MQRRSQMFVIWRRGACPTACWPAERVWMRGGRIAAVGPARRRYRQAAAGDERIDTTATSPRVTSICTCMAAAGRISWTGPRRHFARRLPRIAAWDDEHCADDDRRAARADAGDARIVPAVSAICRERPPWRSGSAQRHGHVNSSRTATVPTEAGIPVGPARARARIFMARTSATKPAAATPRRCITSRSPQEEAELLEYADVIVTATIAPELPAGRAICARLPRARHAPQRRATRWRRSSKCARRSSGACGTSITCSAR